MSPYAYLPISWLNQLHVSTQPALRRLANFIGRLVGDAKTQRVLGLIDAADSQSLDVRTMLENMQHVRGSAQEKYMLKRLKKQQAMQVRGRRRHAYALPPARPPSRALHCTACAHPARAPRARFVPRARSFFFFFPPTLIAR